MPLNGLKECRRLIDDRGAVIVAVPVVVERLSRSRAGLPASYHRQESSRDPGMLVHTAFGANVWVLVARAGVSNCALLLLPVPSSLAVLARP